MSWDKKGLIYSAQATSYWDQKYGLLPTPILINENVIRIFFASTTEDKKGHISFLDVDAGNPSRIVSVHGKTILEPGLPGTFDDCGVNPSCVIRKGNQWLLYYVGYQRSVMTPYSVFAGLAMSDDGINFTRVSRTPVLDRTDLEYSIRSAPYALEEGGGYRMWYNSASGWNKISGGTFDGRLMPTYRIRCTTSDDGIRWNRPSVPCEMQVESDEFGFGRPWVLRDKEKYRMWFSVRSTVKPYRLGYAESGDGVTWERKDSEVIPRSSTGWDSEMVCYSSVITVAGRTFMFYNGNNNGESGFGWAERTEDK